MIKESPKKTLKTFNLDAETYKQFSKHCKENGISMSKKVENFIKEELKQLSPRKKFIQKQKALKPEEHSFAKYCH
jgi:hypothetical protein